ncbi:sugar transporter [Aspergillus ambiguus]|uniref:putative sugar transporter n=1 Tax=Aspergillus ambiguus TaxID=176160 RepID=UPI003CCD06BD
MSQDHLLRPVSRGSTSPSLSDHHDPSHSIHSAYHNNAGVLNRALQDIGMGRYQWQLFALIGFGWASDNLWPTVTSLILLPVTNEFAVVQPPLLTLAQNTGLLAGALFWGLSCDIIGRRWAFNLTIVMTAVFGLAAAFASSFAAIALLTLLWSAGVGGNLPVDSAIFLEFLPGSHQYLLTVLSVHWALAQILANLIAWPLLGNLTCESREHCSSSDNMGWRYFLSLMGGLALLMCIVRTVFFTLYESPKYLMGKGRPSEAVAVVHEIARRNGTTSTLTIDQLHELLPAESHRSTAPATHRRAYGGLSLTDHLRLLLEPLNLTHVQALFATRRLARTTTLLITIWGLTGLGFPLYNAFLPYLQQARGVEFGDGSTYLTYRNNLIVAAAGLPGSLVGGVMVEMRQFGRKRTLFLATAATGLFLLASTTVGSSAALLRWNCAFGFTSALMYAVLYAYTPEMFETQHRGTGNALVSAANRTGGLLAPVIAMVGDLRTTVPVFVAGALFLAAAVLVLLLPYETRGRMSM